MNTLHRGVRWSIGALAFFASLLLLSALAAAEGSWAGKEIMPKAGVLEIKSGDEVVAKSRSAVLTVLRDEGEWLRVRDHGVDGWVSRSQVLLLDDAIEHFTQEIKKDPRAGWAYQKRGVAKAEKGENDSAIEDYNEAIRLDPKDSAAYNNRGLAWRLKDEYDKAIADYDQAIRLDPKEGAAYHNRGFAWHKKEQYDKALVDYDQAIQLDPKDGESYCARGNSWQRKREFEKAFRDFNEAIRLDPKNARAYNERAWLWATCPEAKYRDGRQAVESARQACELTDWKEFAYIDTLAASYAEAGDFDEAVKTQTKAMDLTSEDKKEDYRSRLVLYRDSKPYREEVSAPPVTAASVVKGNCEFAFDLFGRLRSQDGNLFFSPYSISTALAMTYSGAANDTQAEMAQVLHFPKDPAALHSAFGGIIGRLQGIGVKRAYQLHVANALWLQQDFKISPTYFSLVEDRYRAALKEVDFRNAPEEARLAINRWVEGQTSHKIKELLKPGIVNNGTPLVLTNAIYFKAAWSEMFSEQQTSNEDFFTAPEVRTKVPMMHQTETFRYFDGGTFQLLELPYKSNELSMLVVLPKERDGLKETEKSLSAAALEQGIERLEKYSVEVSLPKFRTSAEVNLKDTLVSLGMKLPFDRDRADFSAMTADGSKLYVSAVVHKAYVDVDENGTEAAAATAVVTAPGAGAIPRDQKHAVFRADHPFILLIRENTTGSILFMGRVAKPEVAAN